MIEVGQLRRWTYDGPFTGKIFLVLEHSPFSLLAGVVDDGWIIMESGCEPEWEVTEHIEESSEIVHDPTAAQNKSRTGLPNGRTPE